MKVERMPLPPAHEGGFVVLDAAVTVDEVERIIEPHEDGVGGEPMPGQLVEAADVQRSPSAHQQVALHLQNHTSVDVGAAPSLVR
ncbi:hypothetical protein [Myxococcus sp. CA039A]|uniref:hypothetical protein n=1 Tax=Myxococcus sp. CA039A TaxID=2741737 RepID=UPI0020C71DB7|nr:hypothetical protein [Myxococcus sp. CA039A]